MISRKLALGLAQQYRTCPPADIRSLPQHRNAVLNHLRICPYCNQEPDALEAFFTERCRPHHNRRMAEEPAAVGQIRQILPNLGRWKEGFYINPPMVLLLACGSDIFSAAQVYHDPVLAGPEDVILPEGAGLPHGLVVELWNILDVRVQMLGGCVFRISPEILDSLLQMLAGGKHPGWYILPRPLSENDPRMYFRELEQEIGRVFSLRVRKPLMERLAQLLVNFRQLNLSEIRNIVSGVLPEFSGLHTPPVESFSFSDAAVSSNKVMSRVLTIVSGQVTDAEPLSVELYQSEVIAGFWVIGGLIHVFPQGISESDVYVLHEEMDLYTDADVIQIDLLSGAFLAKFKESCSRKGTVTVLILRTLNGFGVAT